MLYDIFETANKKSGKIFRRLHKNMPVARVRGKCRQGLSRGDSVVHAVSGGCSEVKFGHMQELSTGLLPLKQDAGSR